MVKILQVHVLFVKIKLILKQWKKIRKLNIYSLYSHDDPTLGLEPPNPEDHQFLKLFIGLR